MRLIVNGKTERLMNKHFHNILRQFEGIHAQALKTTFKVAKVAV